MARLGQSGRSLLLLLGLCQGQGRFVVIVPHGVLREVAPSVYGQLQQAGWRESRTHADLGANSQIQHGRIRVTLEASGRPSCCYADIG